MTDFCCSAILGYGGHSDERRMKKIRHFVVFTYLMYTSSPGYILLIFLLHFNAGCFQLQIVLNVKLQIDSAPTFFTKSCNQCIYRQSNKENDCNISPSYLGSLRAQTCQMLLVECANQCQQKGGRQVLFSIRGPISGEGVQRSPSLNS